MGCKVKIYKHNYNLCVDDVTLIVEALQLLIDYKNHGITKNKEITNLLECLDK